MYDSEDVLEFTCSLTPGKMWWTQTSSHKTLQRRDDKDSSFIFPQSRLIKGSVSHSTTIKPCSELTCAGIPRELSGASKWKQSRIISTTFPESCLNKSEVQPWQWQMAKQLAPLNFVSLFFHFASSSFSWNFSADEVCSAWRCWILFTWGDVLCTLKQGDASVKPGSSELDHCCLSMNTETWNPTGTDPSPQTFTKQAVITQMVKNSWDTSVLVTPLPKWNSCSWMLMLICGCLCIVTI